MRKDLTQKVLSIFNDILNIIVTLWIKEKKPQNLKDRINCCKHPTV